MVGICVRVQNISAVWVQIFRIHETDFSGVDAELQNSQRLEMEDISYNALVFGKLNTLSFATPSPPT